MALSSFSIEAGLSGSRITVNDEDVTDRVVAATFAVGSDRRGLPTLTLQVCGGGVIEGEGIVQVVDESFDQRAAVRDWLANLDGETLDDLVSARLQVEPGTFGTLALAVLREMVQDG